MSTDCTTEMNNDSDTDTDNDTPAARAQCYIDVQKSPMLCSILDEDDTKGRADMTVEVWGETNHADAKIYLTGRGDLPGGGDYRAGFEMTYLQARALRDQLDEAIQAFK